MSKKTFQVQKKTPNQTSSINFTLSLDAESVLKRLLKEQYKLQCLEQNSNRKFCYYFTTP